MNNNRGLIITLIVILSIIAISLLALMFMMLNGRFKGFNFGFGINFSNELVLDETYNEVFENIEIDSDASNIIIRETSGEKFSLVIYGDKDRTDVNTDSSTLRIKTEAKKCIGICFNTLAAKIELRVPKDYSGYLDLKNRYGDIEIGRLENVEVEIENNYGDVDIESVKVVDIQEDCGDVKIGQVDDATIKNNFGNIKIDLVKNYMNLKDSCGDIKISEATLYKDSFIENNMGNIKVDSLNEVYVEAKTSLGDSKVSNNYREAEVTLKIENSCGDIKVNN